MATEVVHTIGAAGDYPDLVAWRDAQARDLVALDEIAVAEILEDLLVADFDPYQGFVVDDAHPIIIRAAAGMEWQGDPTKGVRLWNDDATGRVFEPAALDSLIIEGLRVESGGRECFIFLADGTAGQIVIRRSYFNAADRCCVGNGSAFYNARLRIESSVLVNQSSAYPCVQVGTTAEVTVFNSVFYGGEWPISKVSGSIDVRNCVDAGCAAGWASDADANYLATSTNNASWTASTAIPPGNNPLLTDVTAADFVDSTAHNYHLSTASILKGAGADLSADWPGAVDFEGQPFPAGEPWDIGADSAQPLSDLLIPHNMECAQETAHLALAPGFGLALHATEQAVETAHLGLSTSPLLTVAGTESAQETANITLAPHYTLTLGATTQDVETDHLVLLGAGLINLQSTGCYQTTAHLALTPHYSLAVNGVEQAVETDHLRLVMGGSVVLHDTETAQETDHIAVVGNMVVADVEQAVETTDLLLAPHYWLKGVGDTVCYQWSQRLDLHQRQLVKPADVEARQTTDTLRLVAVNDLTLSPTTQDSLTDHLRLIGEGLLNLAPTGCYQTTTGDLILVPHAIVQPDTSTCYALIEGTRLEVGTEILLAPTTTEQETSHLALVPAGSIVLSPTTLYQVTEHLSLIRYREDDNGNAVYVYRVETDMLVAAAVSEMEVAATASEVEAAHTTTTLEAIHG